MGRLVRHRLGPSRRRFENLVELHTGSSRYQQVDVASVVITKLDGHAKGGGALSAVAATQRFYFIYLSKVNN